MEPLTKPRIASLIAAIAIITVAFTVPIVSFVAFGDTVGSHTLYDATLDAFDRDSRIAHVSFALLFIVAAVALFVAHAFVLPDRYALIGGLSAILSVVPLVLYHASAQRVEIFGFELASTSLAFGTFVYAIIGVAHVLAIRFA